jgi:hypothetical protein
VRVAGARGRHTGVLNGRIAASPNWSMLHGARNPLSTLRKTGAAEDKLDTLMVCG